ncbi:MAG: sulfotransferase [Pseudomonadota bacterium]|nr:sulfotransferase [Pseudomonadota bacterium]
MFKTRVSESEFDPTPVDGRQAHGAARAALKRRDHDQAQALLRESLLRQPEDAEALCLLALALWRGPGDLDSASVHLRLARTLRPADPRILTLSASLCLHLGELDSTWSFAEQALGADQQHAPAYVVLARANPRRIDEGQLKRMLSLASRVELGAERLRPLHNAIGRVFDARGEFDAAFGHFILSNRYATGRYEPAPRDARLAEARELFTPDYFDQHRGYGIEDAGCVFVIGMPRSGSTLLEQVLAAHPQTDTCHESDALSNVETSWLRALPAKRPDARFFEHYRAIEPAQVARSAGDYLAATARRMRKPNPCRRIDKRLGNFLFMPLITLMFPDAVVLHTHRHPLDVCLSCFTQGFDGHLYANDLAHLAHFYLNYQGYMRLWSTLFRASIRHCRYEDMIAAFEPQARSIVRSVGLEWDDACAQPHRASRFVSTASAVQVREPAHGARIERWRCYEKHLQPLIEGLGGHANIERLHREFA